MGDGKNMTVIHATHKNAAGVSLRRDCLLFGRLSGSFVIGFVLTALRPDDPKNWRGGKYYQCFPRHLLSAAPLHVLP
jgi:hypothetical protein